MSVEIFDYVNGEKLERLIARTDAAQTRILLEAHKRKRMVQRELMQSKSRTQAEHIERVKDRRRSMVSVTRGRIDAHITLTGPVAVEGKTGKVARRAIDILYAGLK